MDPLAPANRHNQFLFHRVKIERKEKDKNRVVVNRFRKKKLFIKMMAIQEVYFSKLILFGNFVKRPQSDKCSDGIGNCISHVSLRCV